MGACGLEVGNPLFPPSRPPVWTETAFELSCGDMQTISWESYKEGLHTLGEAQMMLSIVRQIFQIFITYAESTSLFLYPAAVNTSEELTAQASFTGRKKKQKTPNLFVYLSAKRMAIKDDWKLNLTI